MAPSCPCRRPMDSYAPDRDIGWPDAAALNVRANSPSMRQILGHAFVPSEFIGSASPLSRPRRSFNRPGVKRSIASSRGFVDKGICWDKLLPELLL
jgi:hypothetical protein